MVSAELRGRIVLRRLVLVSACLIAASCGGGVSPTTPTPPVAGAPGTVTISSSGVSQRQLVVSPGSRVTFVNHDTRAHYMASDPHPDHTDCPELGPIGILQPGQSRESGNFVIPRTCGYHDHNAPTDVSLRGSIIVR